MKKMLIAATAVGAAVAGMILYFGKKESNRNQIKNAAKDAYSTMNDGIGKAERLGQNAMG
jgi:hypothetical protein